jgi:hypothetical protein
MSPGLPQYAANARPLMPMLALFASLALVWPCLAAANEPVPTAQAAPYLAVTPAPALGAFWWPAVVLERAGTHVTGPRSVDETRFGLSLAYRSHTISPHLRALLSPSLGAYHNLAGLAGAGARIHFRLAGVELSYGVGVSIEARLRDSLWLGYATPLELGLPLYRGGSAEHFLFLGLRRSMSGALINSYLLDPNGYDNERSRDRLLELRRDQPWQVYVSLAFGRRVE